MRGRSRPAGRVEATSAGSRPAPRVNRFAIETLEACRPFCQGAYLMPPFNRFEMAGQVLDAVGAR